MIYPQDVIKDFSLININNPVEKNQVKNSLMSFIEKCCKIQNISNIV